MSGHRIKFRTKYFYFLFSFALFILAPGNNAIGSIPKENENSTIESPPIINSKFDAVINKSTENPKIDRIVIFFKDGTFKNYTS